MILGVVLMAAGVICLFIGGYHYMELRFEVNERLPQDQKFGQVFWTPVTHIKFREIRKQVLPNSPRPKEMLRFSVIGFCLFFSGIAFLFAKAR
jgi:hypothetical protein